MSLRKPPALADWLLNRLHLAESNPPLAGDLLEEFQSGRSRAWYWRQTIAAVARDLGRNDRAGRMTATLLGWAAQAVVAYALWRVHLPAPMPEPFRTIAVFAAIAVLVAAALLARRRKRLNVAPDRLKPHRPVVVFIETFSVYLGVYCWFSLVVPWTPSNDFVFCENEIMWLVLAVYSERRRPPHARPASE